MAGTERRPRKRPAAAAREPVIRIEGARVHNLKGIDLSIPRDRFVVLTGVSGSGKSSLAFNTVYAEGQRRYIESLSVYARRFMDQLERPEVDVIEGLPPTVAVEQSPGAENPRSTVATATEVYDYLRLMYARAGLPHCPECGLAIQRQSPEQIVNQVLALPTGQRMLVLAPLVRARKGTHPEAFAAIRRAGLIRARIDGQVAELTDPPPALARNQEHDIEAVVDRLVIREGIRPRLAESVDQALKLGRGSLLLSILTEEGQWADRIASVHLACPGCGQGLEPLEPRGFSFNSPHGACPACDGLGILQGFDTELILPARRQGLGPRNLPFWGLLRPRQARALQDELAAFVEARGLTIKTPLQRWPEPALQSLIVGDNSFPGLLRRLEEIDAAAGGEAQRAGLAAFRNELNCAACAGTRLKPTARSVLINGLPITSLIAMSVSDARAWLAVARFEEKVLPLAQPAIKEVQTRLAYLERVGLGYLTLDRRTDTLSGGEHQRVRLASQIGAGLVGVAFILDEPTAGLHPRDTAQLLQSLRDLRDAGNSVLVVEHDEDTIRSADWVIDLGPGAGPDGGEVVAQGTPQTLAAEPRSVTGRYLKGHKPAGTASLNQRTGRQLPPLKQPGWIMVRGASAHNLKSIDARFPCRAMSCVTGVSGSGKSTLVLDVLARAVRRQLGGGGPRPGTHQTIEGLESITRLIVVDQAPIGRNARSTPATYTGVYDGIRRVFAQTREAKIRGFTASRFSFNVKGGRCEACQGQGVRRIEMQFLPDLQVRCETCEGLRFNQQTLEARYKGLSIGAVLNLRVDEAVGVFEAIPQVSEGLQALHEAGLGYICLGQPSTTLSGGEAQRVKLAAELARPGLGSTLFVLDEPTTGLHFADVERLLSVLQRLADQGHTLVIIEHNRAVIQACDWVVDLGPEGGPEGGQVVAMGRPAVIAACAESHTGRALGS